MITDLEELAKISYDIGFINIFEYHERVKIARWLSDEISDPRDCIECDEQTIPKERCEEKRSCSREEHANIHTSNDDSNPLELVMLGWVFTKSDPDPYPSVPHGHERSQNKAWPKLNPYTGIVFSNKDKKQRKLGKKDMKKIWNDKRFRNFCCAVVRHYVSEYPHYYQYLDKYPHYHEFLV